MALPGFLPLQAPNATAQRGISAPTSRRATQPPAGEIAPASCAWYDYIYAPVACGFVALNEANGTHGYGRSPCTCWQIPLDPIGCAAPPSDRNRLGSISWCE
jgi:hypothetical protein